jgi:hypothetical protein
MVENKRKTAKIVFGVASFFVGTFSVYSLINNALLFKKERRVTKQLMGTSRHN